MNIGDGDLFAPSNLIRRRHLKKKSSASDILRRPGMDRGKVEDSKDIIRFNALRDHQEPSASLMPLNCQRPAG